MDHSGTNIFNKYWPALIILGLGGVNAIPVLANPIPRRPDVSPTSGLEYCLVYTRNNEHNEYSNLDGVIHPSLDDLALRLKGERPLVLGLNQLQCEGFLDKRASDEFFFSLSNVQHWYRKSEFIHESELVPLDRWTTRYIYNNSYLSHVGSEATTRKQEKRLDLYRSYTSYSLPNVRHGLIQYSDDGYFRYTGDGGGRWRIMRHPNRPPNASELDPNLYAIDESGRYLPDGVWGPSVGSRFGYNCSVYDQDKYSCGFGPRPDEDLSGVYFYGRITQFTAAFSPLKIGPDRITITQRVSKGEVFHRRETKDLVQKNLFFYADFEDPIRPVYFASGILLRDPENLSLGNPPRKLDFVQHQICLADCPGDISWQYEYRRRRDTAHP